MHNILAAYMDVSQVRQPFKSTCENILAQKNQHVVTCGSICSGLGVAEMVLENLNYLLTDLVGDTGSLKACLSLFRLACFWPNTHTPPCQFETKFMCELEPWKAKWAEKAFKPNFFFKDMRDLHRGIAEDRITGEFQIVPKAWKH